MSLVDLAKAQADLDAAKAKEESERATWQRYDQELTELWNRVLAGLEEFDGVVCSGGQFKLCVDFYGKSAVLRLEHGNDSDADAILNISAKITSGTYDASDDCRDIPYTEARVTIESPSLRNNRWEYSESLRDLDKVQDVLKKTAEYLSKYFK